MTLHRAWRQRAAGFVLLPVVLLLTLVGIALIAPALRRARTVRA